MTEIKNHRARTSEDYGVYDDAKTYYATEDRHHSRYGARTRTYSQVLRLAPLTSRLFIFTSPFSLSSFPNARAAEQFDQTI